MEELQYAHALGGEEQKSLEIKNQSINLTNRSGGTILMLNLNQGYQLDQSLWYLKHHQKVGFPWMDTGSVSAADKIHIILVFENIEKIQLGTEYCEERENC